MTDGYLYCFSNESMSGILKVGMTDQTPEIRLNEANCTDTWRPPTPYKIEFAKKVLNAKQKETTLHILLTQYTERINPKREFFRISPEEVMTFFDLIDGEMWVECIKKTIDEQKNIKNNRDMAKCFNDGQLIRHTIGINKTWIGVYNFLKNGIIYDTKFYKSLSGFTGTHYSIDRPDRVKSANGWKECECYVNGVWISTYNL
jgi:hypothetical protein